MSPKETLLYRLTELMFEKQQIFLLLDELYEDEVIIPYVRNIQIDSPYQQLLFDGVLSQYNHQNEIVLSFTIEAYFHHLLAKVLQKDERYQSAENLCKLLLNNHLKGLKEGVANLLNSDIEIGNLNRLAEFIDLSEENYEILNIAISSVIESFKIIGIEKSLIEILNNSSNNDWRVLMQSILRIGNSQKNDLIVELAETLYSYYLLNNQKAIHVSVYLLRYFDINKALRICEFLDSIYENYSYINELDRYSFYNSYARYFSYIGDHKKSILLYNQSLEFISKSNFFTPHIEALLYNELGLAYFYSNDFENGMFYSKKGLEIREENYSEFKQLIATSTNNVGLSLNGLGRYDEALEYFIKCSNIGEKELGKFSLEFGIYQHNLGLTYFYKKEFSKAVELISKSYEIKKMNVGEINSDIAITSNVLGIAYFNQNDFENALVWLNKTLNTRISLFGNHHYSLDSTISYLREIYKIKGDYENSVYFSKALINNSKHIYTEVSEKTADAYCFLGDIHFENQDYTNAILNYKEYLNVLIKIYDYKNYELIYAYKSIAVSYDELKEYKLAIDYYKKSLELEKNQSQDIDQNEIADLNECIGDCYSKLKNGLKSIDYLLVSSEIKKDVLGLKDESTINTIEKVLYLAKQLNKENELPQWIKNIN